MKTLEQQLRKARQDMDTREIKRIKALLGLDAKDCGEKRGSIVLSTD